MYMFDSFGSVWLWMSSRVSHDPTVKLMCNARNARRTGLTSRGTERTNMKSLGNIGISNRCEEDRCSMKERDKLQLGDDRIAEFVVEHIQNWSGVKEICRPLPQIETHPRCYRQTNRNPQMWTSDFSALKICQVIISLRPFKVIYRLFIWVWSALFTLAHLYCCVRRPKCLTEIEQSRDVSVAAGRRKTEPDEAR